MRSSGGALMKKVLKYTAWVLAAIVVLAAAALGNH